MKNYITGLVLLATLAACNVSKNIGTPKAALPDTFRHAAGVADTTSIAAVQWKNFFTDATLQSLIDSAITRNYDMQEAVQNIQAAQLLFKQTKWNTVRQVDLNVSANTSRYSDNSLNGLSLKQYGLGTNHIEDYTAYLD